MSRWLIAALLLVGTRAYAEDATNADRTPLQTSTSAPADMSDQAIGASLGVAAGGRTTPGGLEIAGHYLYQMTEQDWFDGVAAFTFGGGDAQCFRDRMNDFLCEHGLADGYSIELAANVRHFLGGNGDFWPFVRGGAGLAVVRFGDDGVTGAAIPLHAGGGLRVSVTPDIAVTAHADLELGIGLFNHSLGAEPQIGASVGAGAEFKL
ncbi:MAG TPA: hypothetical protein VL326_26995 [Kofleriaceae bacterium]|jgi:hypothetical protein|nr:hypothetical protein [Kofleriaceae bacterium]